MEIIGLYTSLYFGFLYVYILGMNEINGNKSLGIHDELSLL